MTNRDQLLALFDGYCAGSGHSRTYVSTFLLKSGTQINRIDAGGDVLTRTFERCVDWFSDNWPENTRWPKGISRPAPAKEAAA